MFMKSFLSFLEGLIASQSPMNFICLNNKDFRSFKCLSITLHTQILSFFFNVPNVLTKWIFKNHNDTYK